MNYIKNWDLVYFSTGEWQVVKERLDDYDQKLVQYNPAREHLFAALRAVPERLVQVAVLGQDPYPKRVHCTGRAFESRVDGELPPTLVNLFKEYQDDLHYPAPKNGDLTKWCEQGVLLWNVYPSCTTGKPGSHHWDEWTYLTKEIVEKLDGQAVFVMLGAQARAYDRFIHHSPTIVTSYPSPLGANHGFFGSRIFSRTNAELCKLGKGMIDWKLPH